METNRSRERAGAKKFPGTTSLDLGTLVLVVRDVIRNLGLHGVRKLAVMNGHLENSAALLEAIDLALRDLRYEGITDIVILKVEYSEFCAAGDAGPVISRRLSWNRA